MTYLLVDIKTVQHRMTRIRNNFLFLIHHKALRNMYLYIYIYKEYKLIGSLKSKNILCSSNRDFNTFPSPSYFQNLFFS